MDDGLPDLDMGDDDFAAARLGAFVDVVPDGLWFRMPMADGTASSPLYIRDIKMLLTWRDDMKKVNAEAMAMLSALETGLVDKVTALEVFEDEDGTAWIKAADLRAAMVMVADQAEEDRG